MSSLRLTFFGSPQVAINGEIVALETRKAQALLAYVVLNRHPQSREKLASIFWPELSTDRAFANLRETLSILRRALTDEWLDVRRHEVMTKASPALWVDVFRFQQHLQDAATHEHSETITCVECLPSLLAAIDLYADDFLRGFTLPGCPVFDEWQGFSADLYRERLFGCLHMVVEHYACSQQVNQAIQYAQRWLALCPWSEAAHRELMRVYALNQQRSEALQQYQRCERMLGEEFGAEPEQETRDLHDAILRPQISLHDEPSPLSTLPAQTTTFIGRETEVATAKHLLLQPDVRLVTLTGPGGTGKTRLGLQVAADLLGHYGDGVCFVSLAPVGNPDLVVAAIVQSLGFQAPGDVSPLDVLRAYLRPKQLLLVLDNFEHILDAAPVVVDLLAAAPALDVLVTSRTVLRVSGEHEYLVPPMLVPGATNPPSCEWLMKSEAARLFAERAKAVVADFELTGENVQAVAEICARLDGLPLAIELAAARVGLLPPQSMLTRLGSPLGFLTAGPRDLPVRQQTLRNTIGWSYDLLAEAEQTLFRRLAVFVGGCTLDAAEAICGISGDLDVLNGLEGLVDHSLLTRSDVGDEPRYAMLETLREYSLERLEESDEGTTICQQHARFYIAFGGEANTHLYVLPVEEHVAWRARLTRDLGNVQAALAWAVGHVEERLHTAVELHEVVGGLMELIGHHEEAVNTYVEALNEVPGDEVLWQARLQRKVGEVRRIQNRHHEALDSLDAAEALVEQGLAESAPEWWQEWVEIQLNRIWLYYRYKRLDHAVLDETIALAEKTQPVVERYGMPAQRARFLQSLTRTSYRKEQYVTSEQTIDIALSALSASQESRNLSLIGMSQFGLGLSYLWAGKLDESEKPLRAALVLSEQIGDVVLQTRSLTYLSGLHRRRGQIEAVRRLIPQCLHLAEMAHMPEYVAAARANQAWIAWHERDLAGAEADGQEALRMWQSLSFVYALQWTALWPLIGVALARDRTTGAVDHVQALLEPSQQRLPDDLKALLKGAMKQWEEREVEMARTSLRRALGLAQELGYL
ncbi:BTAD domain-containing putative transcriptional regulator [Candidatus Latescibacterota bacterium]